MTKYIDLYNTVYRLYENKKYIRYCINLTHKTPRLYITQTGIGIITILVVITISGIGK